SVPFVGDHSPITVAARTPPLIDATEANGSTRLPDLVFTISEATLARSSWGAKATSRTRPLAAPDGSYTVAPNNSLKASVVIRLENTQLTRDSERFSSKMQRNNLGPQVSGVGIPDN